MSATDSETVTKISEYPHVHFDDRGRPIIGTIRLPITMIVDLLESPDRPTLEQVRDGYPALTMAQLYSAMAFYLDHRESIDADRAADEDAVTKFLEKHYDWTAHNRLAEKIDLHRKQHVRASA